jgi:type II secretory ATPase GspE/PulE/Tfp pilus assembly ATPase PilB-like protein
MKSRDFALWLQKSGFVSAEPLQAALLRSESRGVPLLGELIQAQAVDALQVAAALRQALGYPSLEQLQLNRELLQSISASQCVAWRILPIDLDLSGKFKIALADPEAIAHVPAFEKLVSKSAKVYWIDALSMKAGFEKWSQIVSVGAGTPQSLKNPGVAPVRTRPKVQITIKKFTLKDPAADILGEILASGVRKGVSDIHIEPQAQKMRVRFRLEGALFDVYEIPNELKDQITVRTKVISSLDISERRTCQDGRAKISLGTEEVNLRVSLIPSIYGENIVFRVLRQQSLRTELDQIGFDARQLKSFQRVIDSPHGMVLATGPTGSGKTTTLYATLSKLNDSSLKVTTVEDPVEYRLEGAVQVPINAEVGLGFAEALKGIMRQDPDVILLGEIRDLPTAQVAVQAAMTGHLVLATLHTNDAIGSIHRLIHMGLEPFAVVGAVTTVVAQRLIRRVCPHCAQPYQPTEEELAQLGSDRGQWGGSRWVKGQGCETCLGGGYLGRTAIFEVLDLEDEIKELFLKGASAGEIKRVAAQLGMKTLRQSALDRAAAGLTSIDEALIATLE